LKPDLRQHRVIAYQGTGWLHSSRGLLKDPIQDPPHLYRHPGTGLSEILGGPGGVASGAGFARGAIPPESPLPQVSEFQKFWTHPPEPCQWPDPAISLFYNPFIKN
jgi:hypothetical protein